MCSSQISLAAMCIRQTEFSHASYLEGVQGSCVKVQRLTW